MGLHGMKIFNFHCLVSELVKLSDFCPIFAALYFWFLEELIQQTGARHVDADSHCSEELCKSVQIANDTLFKGGVQPEYVGCSLHHYAVCGVVRELHCASLCTALCNTARRPAADSAESCDAPFVNIRQQPPSSPMSATPFVMCEQLFSLPPPRLNIEHLVYLAKSNQCVYFDIIISISAHGDKGCPMPLCSTVHNEITKANKLCRPRTNERPL